MRAGIALGSNLGDRHAQLKSAISGLRNLHEGGEFLTSSFYKTEPQDCPPNSPSFLNAVIEMETSLAPLVLLGHLQAIEERAGRPKSHGFHTPRNLDLDILYCDLLELEADELQLPHPRIRERSFVLIPLCEIRPDLILPGWEGNCQYYLSRNSSI